MAIYAGQIIRAADLSPSEWQPAVLEPPWRNYGSGWSDAQFRHRPLTNTVEVKGTLNGNNPNGSGNNLVPNESLLFRLPEGYRPVANLAVFAGHVSTPVGNPIEVRFYADGRVTVIDADKLTNAAIVIDGVEIYVGE